jgi:hypothetical protein
MSWQFLETLWNEQGPIGQWDHTDDGAHVLALQDVQGGRRLYWDGVWSRPFAELVPRRDGRIFSPDFNHAALYAKRGSDYHVVIDGVESPAYPDLTRSVPPTFSADGARVLYGARIGDRYALIVDGAPLGSDHLAPLPAVFSPDGRRIAYGAEDRHAVAPGQPTERQWVVVDGEAGPPFRGLSNAPGALLFSSDSRRLAYWARGNDGSHLVVDGVAGPAYKDIGQPVFSPDSSRLAYPVVLPGGMAAVIDGQQGQVFEKVGPIVFSPDSRRVAYFARRGKRFLAVVDGSPGPDFAEMYGLGSPVFSPDSRSVAVLGQEDGSGLLGRFKRKTFLVVDGARIVEVDEPSSDVHFSPDGAHSAFAGRSGGAWHMYVDRTPGPEFQEVGVPAWSSSGRLAYPVRQPGGMSVALDHRAGPACAAVNVVDGVAFRFTADGEHVAWAGTAGDKSQPIVDQDAGPWYEGVGRPMVHADRVEWFGLRDGAIWMVSATQQ